MQGNKEGEEGGFGTLAGVRRPQLPHLHAIIQTNTFGELPKLHPLEYFHAGGHMVYITVRVRNVLAKF